MGKNDDRHFLRDDDLNKKIAAELAAMRKEMSMSQEDIARKMEVSQQTVAMIETAARNLTLTKLVRYAAALGAKITIDVGPNADDLYIIRRVSWKAFF